MDFIDFTLYLSYAGVAIAALGFFGFELIALFKNIADSKVTLAGIGGLIVILGISYALGSGEFAFKGIENFGLTEGGLKRIDAVLFTTYILLIIAVLALIADIVMGFVRR